MTDSVEINDHGLDAIGKSAEWLPSELSAAQWRLVESGGQRSGRRGK